MSHGVMRMFVLGSRTALQQGNATSGTRCLFAILQCETHGSKTITVCATFTFVVTPASTTTSGLQSNGVGGEFPTFRYFATSRASGRQGR